MLGIVDGPKLRRVTGFGARGFCFLLLLLVGHISAADNPDKRAKEPAARRQEYEAIVGEYDAARAKFFKAYKEAKTEAEREKLGSNYPQSEDYSRRLLELARREPKDEVTVDALVWVVTNDRYGETLQPALDLLLKDHIDHEKMGEVASILIYSKAEKPDEILQKIVEKNPKEAVKGQATFTLGLVKLSQDKTAEAEKIFEEVIARFGNVTGNTRSLADSAKGQLFEIRNLGIGKVAPEIAGEDVEGKHFKLSDYRGKVVVIDFWGDW